MKSSILMALLFLIAVSFVTGLPSTNLPLSSGDSSPAISKHGTMHATTISESSRKSSRGLSHQMKGSHNLLNTVSSSHSSQFPFTSAMSSNAPTKRSLKIPIYLLVLLPKSPSFLFSIERVSPAISLATDNVTTTKLLTRHRLVTLYADSKCHIAAAMNEAIKFYIEGKVHAFLGPVCDYSMAPLARQAKYWNLPVITSGAMARDFSEFRYTLYNTLTRVGSRYNTLIEFLAVVFKHYNYSRVNLVYEPHGQNNILDKLCHVMTDGIHNAFKNVYNISNVATKYMSLLDTEGILRDQIGIKFGGRSQLQCITL